MTRRNRTSITPLSPSIPVAAPIRDERGRPGRPASVQPQSTRSPPSSTYSQTDVYGDVFAMDSFSPPDQPTYAPPNSASLQYSRRGLPSSPTDSYHDTSSRHHRRNDSRNHIALPGLDVYNTTSVQPTPVPPRQRVRSDVHPSRYGKRSESSIPSDSQLTTPFKAASRYISPASPPLLTPPSYQNSAPAHRGQRKGSSVPHDPGYAYAYYPSSKRHSGSSSQASSYSSGPHLAPSPRSSGHFTSGPASYSPQWYPNNALPSPPVVTSPPALLPSVQSVSDGRRPSMRIPIQRSSSSYDPRFSRR